MSGASSTLPVRAVAIAAVLVVLAVGSRALNVAMGPVLHGYDALGHMAYVFFLDLYHAIPYADQGWSYFHPPLHYAVGWGLAQFGSSEVLVRGLMAWNSAASLGIAGLSAWLVRRAFPERPEAALLAFAAVAFLPPHVYASGMPGNELTAALLSTAAFASFLVRERSGGHSTGSDCLVGGLLAGALLAKYNAAIPMLAILGTLGIQGLRTGTLKRAVPRMAVIAGVACLISGPYYARNALEFGTPFPLAGHRPVVDAFEAGQPPGERSFSDLVRVSPRLFVDPDPRAPHMLHSVWGTLYAAMWVHEDREQSGLSMSKAQALLLLGLLPTALVVIGFWMCGAAAFRRREDPVPLAVCLLAFGGLLAMVLFSFQTPTFAALKAMYLLNVSPAFAVCLVYGAARAPEASARLGVSFAVGLSVVLAGSLYTRGVSLPSTPETLQMAAVRTYFGEWDGARTVYEREWQALKSEKPRATPLNPLWLQGMRAGLELEAGRYGDAARTYANSLALRMQRGGLNAFAANRAAVAFALAGDVDGALRLLEVALAERAYPEVATNRAVLLAYKGDVDTSVHVLGAVLAERPTLAPALALQARLAEEAGDSEAASLQAAAVDASQRAPRGYPYAAGDGRGLNTQLYMLSWTGAGLELYSPERSRR